jgi:SAM-dependent methyltransferase
MAFEGRTAGWYGQMMKFLKHLNIRSSPNPLAAQERFPIERQFQLPTDVSETQLYASLGTLRIDDAPPTELRGYLEDAFWRVIHTWSLAKDVSGKALELGANPYFITRMLLEYTDLDLTLANYFGQPGTAKQQLSFATVGGTHKSLELQSDLFNIESDAFPYADESYNLVIFCEIIEHLLNDVCHALSEINRILKPGGYLILTTPNVDRLKNVLAMISGANIYDPYSGYGPYGRHNREYNRHELWRLLGFAGFEFDEAFTADAHREIYSDQLGYESIAPLIDFRREDLGQYIFIRARKVGSPREGRPSFLYRSRSDIVEWI